MEFFIPGAKSEILEVRSPEEAYRVLYFKNRRYIFEKLMAWLQQRNYAVTPYPGQPDYTKKLAAIFHLRNQLVILEQASFHQLCAFVARKADVFRLLAPADKSRHYHYYQYTVKPILSFCLNMAGRNE